MRDRETIESELRRIAARGGRPSSREADRLLDELLAHSAGVPYPEVEPADELVFVPDTWSLATKPKPKTAPRPRKGALRRFGFNAALPLSVVALVAAVVVMLTMHRQSSPQQSAETPPSAPPPSAAPSAASPKPMAPKAPSAVDVVDMAFVEALKHEGVPVPSQEYATAHGHAVCDFLARQRNFADAVAFVQKSSIWDADQSTDVTAGAIVSYCPQSRPSMADQTPNYQNTLSDLQAIEGKLQGIQDDLHGIQGGLDNLPGRP
jgi:hypothetical protein